ncbi:hypothetical protein F1559_001682 [Cyanidiococcus yangmingshanensis]|uniref:Endonuclease/exonuclease/phosphatase domain-containing protein n=1 Tax=Cyanidiococcus yangmingshanensis TaxID=2690220 RepID=A0A7J7ILX1_9RHOD|nr:hypothetical protein F1559_001682 [Cyanidiococcus yangmingshanensis]
MTLLRRSWIPARSSAKTAAGAFRVASYNVLAQTYIRSELFPYCPRGSLRSRQRIPKLLNEIGSLEADLLCLQEVDFYESALENFLSREGYVSVFRKRPGRKADGCCIAFRGSRFEVLSCADWCYDTLTSKYGNQRRLRRNNIGMAVVLRDNYSGVCFVLGTTHMLWDPLDPDVKVLQAADFVGRALEVARGFGTPFIVLAGDLNSTPESHAMRLLFEGSVYMPRPMERVTQDVSGDLVCSETRREGPQGPPTSTDPPLHREALVPEGTLIELPENFSFCSAYAAVNPDGVDICWTNRRPQFTATIDYILVPTSQVDIERALWSPEGLADDFFLPNEDFPSDHIPVVADLCFKNGV